MAAIKNKDLKAMSNEELKSKISELKMELLKENAQIATGTTPKSPGKIKSTKKTIARILTIINNKKREEPKTEKKETKEKKAEEKPKAEEKKEKVKESK